MLKSWTDENGVGCVVLGVCTVPQRSQLALRMLVTGVLLAGVGCRRLTDAEPRAQIEVYVDRDLTAPKFHDPLTAWRAGHGQALRRRQRSRCQCVLCHDPPRHCTKCHVQTGARDIIDKPLGGAVTLAASVVEPTPAVPPRAYRLDVSADLSRHVTTMHVERVVQRLAERGQRMRDDGLAILGEGNDRCLPCHTGTPGTARSLKPIHVTMIEGMQVGLTSNAPKGIRRPRCLDCHAYPPADADVLAGDLKFDVLHRPCVQRECHTDRDFKWALTFVGHLKQAIKHVPSEELFAVREPDGRIGRHVLKRIGVVVSWLLILATFAGMCLVGAATERGGRATHG